MYHRATRRPLSLQSHKLILIISRSFQTAPTLRQSRSDPSGMASGKRFCALSARKPRKPNGPEAQRAEPAPEMSAGLDCSRPAGTAESGTSALVRALMRHRRVRDSSGVGSNSLTVRTARLTQDGRGQRLASGIDAGWPRPRSGLGSR